MCWLPECDLQETLFYNRYRSARTEEKGQLYSKLSSRPLAAYVVLTLPCFYTMKLDNVGSITPRPSPYPQGHLFVSQSSRFLLVWKSRQKGQKTQWILDRLKNRQVFYLKAPWRIRTFEFYTLFCWNEVSYYPDLQAHATRPVQVTHFLQVFIFFFNVFLVSDPRRNTIQVYFWGANILKGLSFRYTPTAWHHFSNVSAGGHKTEASWKRINNGSCVRAV